MSGRDKSCDYILVNYINKIIKAAVYYGGDPGGPYCCNKEDKHTLIRQLELFRKWYGLNDYCIIEVDNGNLYQLGKIIDVEKELQEGENEHLPMKKNQY